MKTSLAAVAITIAVLTVKAVDPIFYSSFDDTVTPVFAAGEKTSKLEVPPVFKPGLKGKALLVGLDEQNIRRGVTYSHKKI